MKEDLLRSTAAKALKVNLDLERYGTFAEIGAGQEVARHFFQAGRASQTIAKTISAYDMIYSDEIYGKEKNNRYVCESRLLKMLDKEFNLMLRRLGSHRGDKTLFFAFANTVATGTAEIPKCHGWMGVRFQAHPKGQPNDIILHVRMMDKHRLQQQEALGILGVNLIEAAFYHCKSIDEFITNLSQNIREGQMMIDTLKFSGPDLKHLHTPLANLELINRGLSEAVLFNAQAEIVPVGDAFYGKSLILLPGTLKNPAQTYIGLLQKALAKVSVKDGLPVLSLSASESKMDVKDYLKRVEAMTSKGQYVLVSRFKLFFQLKSFIRKFNQNPMTFLLGPSQLERILEPEHYKHLEGGLLEGIGKLFDDSVTLLINTSDSKMDLKSFKPGANYEAIYQFYLKNKQIKEI